VNEPDPNRPVSRHPRRPGQGPLRPVCGHARLRGGPGVSRRGNDAEPELFDAATGAAHRVSPAAAELWAALDGRRLSEVRPGPTGDPDVDGECEVELTVIELVRRFKALGLIEDLP
jgi:hypothetical protein